MRNALVLAVAAFAVAVVAAAGSADAKNGKGKGPHWKAEKMQTHGAYKPKRKHHPVFSSSDDRIIRVYFGGRNVAWTALPPGIAKNYARGKPLPPGIAKKVLPRALIARLPYRPGYQYVRVGADIVLIETTTLLIVDILMRVLD